MGKLFMIGNGFDLGHDLPTRYSDFYQYLLSRADGQVFIENIERVISCWRDQLWNDFEGQLGSISPQYVMEVAISEREDYNAQFDYDTLDDSHITNHIIEKYLSSLHKLDEFVSEWIQTVTVNTVAAKPAYERLFQGDTAFITFNYTDTLEEIYRIKKEKVHHVHGDADEPIMGHGKDHPGDLAELVEADEDFVLEEFKDEIRSELQEFYHSSKKDVPLFIGQLETFIDQLEFEVDEIHILGHSLGEVDLPYFEAVMNHYPDAHWIATYFNPQDKDYKAAVLKKMNSHFTILHTDDYLQAEIKN